MYKYTFRLELHAARCIYKDLIKVRAGTLFYFKLNRNNITYNNITLQYTNYT